jgi:hypothetical protein
MSAVISVIIVIISKVIIIKGIISIAIVSECLPLPALALSDVWSYKNEHAQTGMILLNELNAF